MGILNDIIKIYNDECYLKYPTSSESLYKLMNSRGSLELLRCNTQIPINIYYGYHYKILAGNTAQYIKTTRSTKFVLLGLCKLQYDNVTLTNNCNREFYVNNYTSIIYTYLSKCKTKKYQSIMDELKHNTNVQENFEILVNAGILFCNNMSEFFTTLPRKEIVLV